MSSTPTQAVNYGRMNVTFKQTIPAPARKIFDAIITGSKMSNYFISQSDGDLVEGTTVKWQFAATCTSIEVGVTRIKIDRFIQFTWKVTGKPTIVEIARLFS